MFGFELLGLVLFAFVVSLVRSARRKRSVSNDLDVWAEQLGMVRVGNELFGEHRNIPVGARLAFDAPQGARLQARWTLYARLQPPLDLGLLCHPRSLPIELPGSGMLEAVAHGSFGRRFRVVCDEPSRAQALLSTAVKRAMMAWLHEHAMFMLTDAGVAVQTTHTRADEKMLKEGLNAVAAIANEVNTARARVPAAHVLRAHQAAWTRFAGSSGLTGISAPLCMFGTIEDATTYAYSVRTAPGEFHLEVWLRFEDPLALGLLVQPMRTVDRVKGHVWSDGLQARRRAVRRDVSRARVGRGRCGGALR